MKSGLGLRRRRKKRKPDSGARLVPLEVDDDATDELFAPPTVHRDAAVSAEFVIDLPSIEKSPEPLPRRVDPPRRHLPTRGALNRRDA
jgi:hypothetical protein